MAGCPVALISGVNGTKVAERRRPRMGSSGVGSKLPSGRGGSARVGVSQTSQSPKKRATSRETRWRSWTAVRYAAAERPSPISYSTQVRGSKRAGSGVCPVRRAQSATVQAQPADHSVKNASVSIWPSRMGAASAT